MMNQTKKPKLRKLKKSVLMYFFTFLFVYLFFWIQDLLQTQWPYWTWAFLFPLALLGMVTGIQLQMYLEKKLGKKAVLLLEILLAVVLIVSLFAEYNQVVVPLTGGQPITWQGVWERILHKLPAVPASNS